MWQVILIVTTLVFLAAASYSDLRKREVPDYAYDKHTLKGKRMGRGMKHFFSEGAKINNISEIEDVYAESAKNIMLAEDGELFN